MRPLKIRFRRFEPGDRDGIARLNERLRAAGLSHIVGSEPAGVSEASLDSRPIVERMFVVAEGEEIRGAVWLREQQFWCRKGAMRAGWMIYPVSESLSDRRFAGVPGTLLLGLLRQQPRLMALGMGGGQSPFARLLAGARWRSELVPFWFRLLRPARVLRRLPQARSNHVRRAAANALAVSGLARVGHGILSGLRRVVDGRPPAGGECHEVDAFDGWADALWERSRERYGLIALRDGHALDALYPSELEPLTRLRVQRGGQDIGWICAQTLDAKGTWLEPHFGDLTLGILTDAFADPADAAAVIEAGTRQLVDERVDLIVTHQLHPAWCSAARRLGFWKGPSNLAFSWSPAVNALLDDGAGCHMTRSDGDGPQVR